MACRERQQPQVRQKIQHTELPLKTQRLDGTRNGDFYAVYKRLQWLPKEEQTVQRVMQELVRAVTAKEPHSGRKLGF